MVSTLFKMSADYNKVTRWMQWQLSALHSLQYRGLLSNLWMFCESSTSNRDRLCYSLPHPSILFREVFIFTNIFHISIVDSEAPWYTFLIMISLIVSLDHYHSVCLLYIFDFAYISINIVYNILGNIESRWRRRVALAEMTRVICKGYHTGDLCYSYFLRTYDFKATLRQHSYYTLGSISQFVLICVDQ